MAGFLGALEYVLEEGPRNDWFGDDTVLLMAWVSGLSAIVFFVRVLTAKHPIVDLRAFKDRNFGLGSLFSFVLGIGLYGLTYLYPVYLAQVRGYNALMIGETMFVSGVAMFLTAPIAGRLMNKVDPRLMLIVGFLSFAAGTYWMTYLTKDWDFWELFWPQVFRGVGLMIAMIPINNIALGTLPPERVKNASGLFNLTRNLGGAVGLAALTTILNDRTDLHLARLHEAVTLGAAAGAGSAQQHDPALLFLRQRRPADGHQAAERDRPSPGRGDGVRRRVPGADGAVRGPRLPGARHEAPGPGRRPGGH